MESMDTANEQVFPQFTQGSWDSGQAPAAADSRAVPGRADYAAVLYALRHQPAVHHRPQDLISFQPDRQGGCFVFHTAGRESRVSWTHETSLHLYGEATASIPSLSMRIEFWRTDLFRVTLTDGSPFRDVFAGLPEEGRMLVGAPESVQVRCRETDTAWILETADLSVSVEKRDGRISAADRQGMLRFAQKRSLFKAADIFDTAVSALGSDRACFEALELEPDELIYGLGERFDGVVRNGRQVDFHNKDAVGTTSPRTYVNIPFFMSTKGYGLFLNSGAPTRWEVGTLDASALQFSVLEPQMDYFVIAAGSPKQILKGYCSLTGFPQLPPLWSFGLWMSRNSYTSWEVTDEIARQIRDQDIPCDVLHLDTAWFSKDWNCDLKFSEERFPDPEKHLADYRRDGFHVSLWQYNFIPPREDNTHYLEAVENGYLAKDGKGQPYHLPENCRGSWVDDVIVDFSSPDARAWYGTKIKALMELGAGAIKTDFGEGIPEDAVYAGIEGKYFHNLYALVYNATVFNACKSVTGENLVWARSGTAGSQRYPLHWGGDSQCTFDALAGTLRAALSAGISGIPFFSHDIGGFLGMPSDELYVRWAQLGLFSSHSRCHGAGDHTHREPWYFSREACDIFRKYDKLRYSLMPYIYSQAKECTETGLPMMRALWLEYPEDPNVRSLDDEYLFGSRLLIAPVLKPLSRSSVRSVYLPRGVWYDYFTKERFDSRGEWIQKPVALDTLPIYVRYGTVLEYCSADRTLCEGMGDIIRTEVWNME